MHRYCRVAIVVFMVCGMACGASAQTLTSIVDNRTGVQVALPPDILASQIGTKWGMNWRSAANRLNIDTLDYGTRSLIELHTTLRNISGRRITNSILDQSRLVLEGRDRDGTWFYVVAAQRGGVTRGLSVVYSDQAFHSLAQAIVNSFVAFPAPAMPPPTQLAERAPLVIDQPQSSNAASQQISDLKRELGRVQEQLKEQELERQRQKDIEAIRKQERERLKEEFTMRDQERITALQVERERESRQAQLFADERKQAREREAELEKKIAAIQKDFKIQQSEALVSTGRTVGKRVAFIVGINKYTKLPAAQQLKTAVNDARMIGATLERLGFQVTQVATDVTRSGFNSEWQKFLNSIGRGSIATFFFAGHGVQIDGQNYLLPSDVPPVEMGQAEFLVNEALSFNVLLEQMAKQAPSLSLVILDACRDNPFAGGTRAGGQSRGLASIDKVKGTFVMYSAAAGQTALDRLPNETGDIENSVYTRTLLPLLLQEGLNINQVALRVRAQVADLATRASNHQQHPAYYDGLLEGTLCLVGSCSEPRAAAK